MMTFTHPNLKKSVKLLFNMYKNYTKLIKNEIRRISDHRLKEVISNNLKSIIKRTKVTSSFYFT